MSLMPLSLPTAYCLLPIASFVVTATLEFTPSTPGLPRMTTMPKFEYESHTEPDSAFFERRRLRRVRMIVELTMNLISSDRTVSHREARCLVDCARKAILELFPGFEFRYERIVQPSFSRVLQQRWPEEELSYSDPHEMVN
jgi:hypothetical protein